MKIPDRQPPGNPNGYPTRPPFFAHKFVRLLLKSCVANELGPDACWLLTIIAHTEDAKHYRDAETYFNQQLAPLMGFGSVDSLDRLRQKCVAAGWLHYIPGKKRNAGKYWVLIPKGFERSDDAPSDENPDEYYRKSAEENGELSSADSRSNVRRKPGGKCGGNPEESADPSSLPFPLPFSASIDAGDAEKKAKKKTEKKPRKPNPLFDAIAEVTNAGKSNASHVGKVAAEIAKDGITPEQVRDFANRWRELLPWAKPAEHPALTVGIIGKHMVPALRNAAASSNGRVKHAADNVMLKPPLAPPPIRSNKVNQ